MNKSVKTLFLFTSLTSLVSCATDEKSDAVSGVFYNSIPPVVNSGVKLLKGKADTTSSNFYLNDDYLAFNNKMLNFSSKLSDEIIWNTPKEENNFAFSPYSIELCLGLAARCANGNTRNEILNAMGIDYQTLNEQYHRFYEVGSFIGKTNTGDISNISAPANSIWINKQLNLEIKEECLDALSKDYYCDSYSADFTNKNKEANEAMREYIYRNTRGLINPDLNMSKETLFVLMNTLYIKDIWNDLGNPLGYADSAYQFKNSDGSYSSKQLLSGYSLNGRAYYGEDYSSFYTSTNNSFTITFIKPNEGKELKDVFNEATIYETLNRRYETMNEEKKERYHTACIFPEFKAGSDFYLEKAFKNLGINSLFDLRCDFSNIFEGQTMVETVRHMASLDVNKKGIEGAAVTYIQMAGAVGPDDWTDVYEKFVVDKEFGFILTGRPGVLFTGIVTNID